MLIGVKFPPLKDNEAYRGFRRLGWIWLISTVQSHASERLVSKETMVPRRWGSETVRKAFISALLGFRDL